MLELRDISKKYVTGNFTQVALDHISVAFRDSEFVAVLGPSGSGKTTMLNVVGGLDHFDSGDLLVDGISTKRFRDRDWDAYRNNRIGFVFQSYNLIPHQTILANVELALTLSGVSRAERRKRALKALADVGLADHVDKRPAQLSGGQMQRVAIARALINDPEILLADEPTGALDSVTSVQVMDLLKEVSRDRLVVMVTHNPELARQYATRIVELRDGHITSDSDPFEPGPEEERRPAKPTRKTSMSFFTAMGLSFNNLMTKKGRTIMTAFAGSIGIIGIAAILSLANGVNNYINNVEEETLSAYPVQISEQSVDMSSMLSAASAEGDGLSSRDNADSSEDGTVATTPMVSNMAQSVGSNDTASLKTYLDENGGGIRDQVSAIEYKYNVTPQIFLADTSNGPVQVNPESSFSSLGMNSAGASPMGMSTNVFSELPDTPSLFEGQYDVKAGRWPEAADELVLVLDSKGKLLDLLAYDMGLRDHGDLEKMVSEYVSGEAVDADDTSATYTYDQLMAPTFSLVNASDMYTYEDSLGVWSDRSDDEGYMESLVENGTKLHIVGIVQPKPENRASTLSSGLYYTKALTQQVISAAQDSQIVQDQIANPDVDVFTGETFEDEAAGNTSKLDFSSFVTVDGTKFQSAFSFDSAALASSASNLDLSGLDLSSMDLSSIAVPQMDPSELQLDAADVPQLSADDLKQIFPNLTEDQVREALSGVSVKFKDGGQERLAQALTQVAQGWAAWQKENPDGSVADYIASDAVSEKIRAAVEDAIDTDDLKQQLTAAVGKLTGSEATTPEGVGEDVVNKVLALYQQKVAGALTTAITSAVSQYVQSAMTQIMTQATTQIEAGLKTALTASMQNFMGNMAGAMKVDESKLADAFQFNLTEDDLKGIMSSLLGSGSATYEGNLTKLGYADLDKPSEIDIYPTDFTAKDNVISILNGYNDMQREAGEDSKVVSWSDMVGAMMSSVSDILNMVTAMLVAFVSISLVVSSIMIGIITYISVLERKKEIGILRSIGASKHNISEVFNAETVIEGFVAGAMGILITLALLIPANAIIESNFDVVNLAQLPPQAAAALIAISVALTFIAGLIPAAKASREDPVEALRSE
ncbi:ATP-binding cassette domain-containing protein [Olsenella sp. AM05-17]|jgi:putative ABC transport system permease protein|nr:ABC transporter ATP-binding protein/permease [Olsenella sp. AM05-17]RGS50737.1 ATP-binding cassette domain-containing protein [Olsenella sp. AF21-51]RHJ98458.1 ATP-binding cassette domain-containing protein [Olsenella sp. AM05-17]